MQRTTRPLINVLALVILLLFAAGAWARPTTPEQAKNAVLNWLGKEARPMGAPLGGQIKEVQTFIDRAGSPAYYVVYLNPSGLVFLPADDLVEPLIGFVSEATSYDPSATNPLGALVSRDLPGRVLKAREMETQAEAAKTPLAPETPWAAARQKWAWLAQAAPAPGQEAFTGIYNLSDIWVAPFVSTHWGQGWPPPSITKGYNYYTPNHDPCGCVATAMAQLMRYWKYPYPPSGPIVGTFYITVEGSSQYATIRGGDSAGGPYDWSNMPPGSGSTTTEQQAIGALTYDAGVSVDMNYTSGFSYTGTMHSAANAFYNTFKYSNAICGDNYRADLPAANRNAMVNPNLNAKYPVLFGILDSGGGGHAVVCDGYGYNALTMYHHINMGWEGDSDAWYNLPNIGSDNGAFTTINECVYNVFINGSGVLIGGRVTDGGGKPVGGAMVTATAGGQTYSAVSPTASSGVYAIRVPANTTFTVSVAKAGFTCAPQSVTTDYNYYRGPDTGNVWGVDFVGQAKHGISSIYQLLLN